MNVMDDPLNRKQQELAAFHRANGHVNVREMLEGTRIVIKTVDEVYELEVGTAKFGVVLIASNGRFEQRIKAVVEGSLDPETSIFVPEIIGEGLKIMLRSQKGGTIHTQPVTGAKIVGIGYNYELWRN